MNIQDLSLVNIHKALVAKEFSVRDLVDHYMKVIIERNENLNAYLEIFDDVIEQAGQSQKHIDSGSASILTGIPLAIKDNILLQDRHVSASSKILEGYVAPYDATVIKKLKSHQAVFLGRTNCDEFAMGSSNENSAYGVVKNPHDELRVPGGSSGGSAAAVASGMACAALGSDTGGSIRQPAALCGIVGLKPTYGSVSRSGLIAMSSSLDVIGPLTKTVSDAEVLFNEIRGEDTLDSTSHDGLLNNKKERPRVVGVPRAFVEQDAVDSRVQKLFDDRLDELIGSGYEVQDIDIPELAHGIPTYYIIMPAEASSNLARYDGVRFGLHVDGENGVDDFFKTRGTGFGSEVRRRIVLGTYVLSSGHYDAYYNRALSVREAMRRAVSDVFSSGIDIIATPTTTAPAFKLGEKTDDPLSMYYEDVFTVSANITGVPALSVPMGTVRESNRDLPVGMQCMAPHNDEASLFTIGKHILGEGE